MIDAEKKPQQNMKELKKTSDMATYFLREIHRTWHLPNRKMQILFQYCLWKQDAEEFSLGKCP